jgi:uncharacterized protein
MEANERFVRSIFEETARGNGRVFADALADDCRWIFPGTWSWSRTWSPKQAIVQDLLVPLMRQFDGSYRVTADDVIAAGDRVVVHAHGSGVTIRGDAYDQSYCFTFRVRDERITEVIEHCDTALVERVLDPIP